MTEQKAKADPTKPFDVIITVVNDDRAGHTSIVKKPVRVSFALESEALEFESKILSQAE